MATKKPAPRTKMTEAQDMKYDMKMGIKEGSARDMKLDAKNGLKPDTKKMKMKKK